MKTTSDALFRLIHAMTKGEKTYFKKSTSGTNKAAANYIKLFDAIAKAETYDEEALLKKFRREAFVKNFVETKQYLKNQILKALRNYQSNKSVLFKLREDISDIELLLDKGIFDLAKTQIKKSLKIAEEHEVIHVVLKLNELQFKLLRSTWDTKGLDAYKEHTIAEEVTLLQQLQHIKYYRDRYFLQIYHWKKYGPMQLERSEPDLAAHPLDSFEATNLHLLVESNIGQIFNDVPKLYQTTRTHYELFQQHPKQIDLKPVNYIASVLSHSNACAKANQIEEGLTVNQEGIQQWEAWKQNNKISPSLYIDRAIRLYSNQLRLYLHHGSKTLFQENYQIYKTLVLANIEHASTIFVDLCTVFFSEIILEDWEAAANSYQQIIGVKARGQRTDLDAIVRLLGILVYYESDQHQLLEASLDAAYQFTRTKDFLFKYTLQVINLFKYKLLNALNEKETLQHLEDFRSKSIALFEDDPNERNILAYFDFIAWLNSKIEGISIHEAYCKRLQAAGV